MTDYRTCCSTDGHSLSYPGFSVVFIQTFSIHHTLSFCVAEDFINNPENLRASEMGKPMVYRDRHIEHQIFVRRSRQTPLESKYKTVMNDGTAVLKDSPGLFGGKSASAVKLFPQDSVYRFALRGFNFELPVEPEDESLEKVVLKGHVSVEMSLFFGHTVSLTYRFLFDGDAAKVLDGNGNKTSAATDHIIALLSTYLGAEFWSRDKEAGQQSLMASQSDINLETSMQISDFWFDDDGNPLPDGPQGVINLGGKGRTFDRICAIYKKYIYNHCTAYASNVKREERVSFESRREGVVGEVRNDLHYAMVDIWENVSHVGKDGKDLFSKKRAEGALTEAEIINHIRDYHRPELIGLMTLYPGEWPFRDANAYDEVCGENIAIDTDDLVLVGHNMAVVIGTYGRRGSDAEAKEGDITSGVDWSDHLKERRKYHVSWPEYLLILQMVLAKKYRIGLAKNQMIDVTMKADDATAEELIEKNAKLGMRLSRMIVQLDVVKYSKFASHVVMFDRTTKRLGLDKDLQELREIIQMVDDSLQNLSDFKSMKSDYFMNVILGIISVVSAFEIMFQSSELPFLTYFNVPSTGLAAWIVISVMAVVVFALLYVLKKLVVKVYESIFNR
ncbi:MAG: hypothetical protein IKW27_04400 [Bacteroidales bacterium]|nr:hypothetical protein [Bacteroidales bacterium]